MQKLSDLLRADGVPPVAQLVGKLARALRRPAQWRLRITAGDWIYQRLKGPKYLRARLLDPRTPTAGSPDVDHIVRAHAASQLVAPHADRRPRQARRSLHRCDPTLSDRIRFRGCPQPAHPFIHYRVERLVLRSNLRLARHSNGRSHFARSVDLIARVVCERSLRVAHWGRQDGLAAGQVLDMGSTDA